MRVTIYDRNPGSRAMDKFLALSWLVGCWLQKLFGAVDKYYGAESWVDAVKWLEAQPAPLVSIQYWGHGSPGQVWLASEALMVSMLSPLRDRIKPDTVIWFRTCSTFAGLVGHSFSARLSNLLGCVVAGHTRIIGIFQGGLHTRKPNTEPSWPVTDGEFPKSFWRDNGLIRGENAVFFLTTKIPKGW